MKAAALLKNNMAVYSAAFLAVGVVCNLSVYYSSLDLSPLEGSTQIRDQILVPTPVPTDGSEIVDIVETHVRPLFSPSRKVFHLPETYAPSENAPAEPTAPIELNPPDLRLHGTRELSGVRAGLVSIAPSGSEEWIIQGSAIAGWTVSQITQDSLTLSHASQIRTYLLYDERVER